MNKNLCFLASALFVFVCSFHARAQITGSTSLCVAASSAFTDATTGGLWSSSNTGIATIGSGSGIATGVSAGTATITYTVLSVTTTVNVTVNAAPVPISGYTSMCGGYTTTLTDGTPGGTWSSSSTGVATIGSASGMVTSLTEGFTTITYALPTGCAAATSVYVSSNPPGTLIGCNNLGVGDTLFFPSDLGGMFFIPEMFYSSNPSVLQSLFGGYVVGISPGTATLTLFNGGTGCAMASLNITVTPTALIHPITGANTICQGTTTTLADINSGGTWNSSAPAVATIGSSTGVVTGVSGGSSFITYAVPGATCTSGFVVNSLPVITGPGSVCLGDSIMLTGSGLYGTPGDVVFFGARFSSSDTTVAYLKQIFYNTPTQTCTLNALSTGTAIITLTDYISGCSASVTETVNALPTVATISGPASVCVGTTITFTDATPGGAWTSSNTDATIASGVVTGVSPGVDTITYTITNACGTISATKVVSVDPVPTVGAISGASGVCVGAAITLTDATTGGTWSSTNGTATVSGGVVTGVTAGVDTIFYSISTCATVMAMKIVTINPLPVAGTIAGASGVCAGSTVTLTDSATGGTWSSTNGSATVLGGVVTGVYAGTDTVMYTVTNTCGTDVAVIVITVVPLPIAGTITGLSLVCVGTPVTLADVAPGGTWSSTNGNATVSGGIVTGVTNGMDTIQYSVTNVCGTATATKVVTINIVPVAGTITGASSVCAGSVITLTDGTTGGIWSGSNGSATVSGGAVTGVYAGTDTVLYTVTNACGTDVAAAVITVNPLPIAGTITGPSLVCIGTPITLADITTGGTWGSTNPGATVTGGIVTGVSSGPDTIQYSVTNVCGTATATKAINIEVVPVAGTISGPAMVCVGSTITLAETSTGGIWSSGTPLTASIGSATGIITGVMTGGALLSYSITNGCGSAVAQDTITVNPMPYAGAISGPTNVCAGDSITLTDPVTGGIWSSSSSIATVSGGTVTGVSGGNDTIAYSVTNVCGVASAIKVVTVDPLPPVHALSGGGSYCVGGAGVHIFLTGSDIGINYQLYMGLTTVGSPVAGTGTIIDLGLFSATGTYSVVATNATTACTRSMGGSIAISTTAITVPVVAIAAYPGTHVGVGVSDTFVATVTGGGSIPTYQWYVNGIAILGATSNVYISSTLYSGDSISCDVVSSLMCGSSAGGSVTVTLFSVGVKTVNDQSRFAVFPNPNRGIFTVSLSSNTDEGVTIVVANIMGEKVKEFAATTNENIAVDIDVPTGVYFVSAVTSQGTWSKKIVVGPSN